MAEASVLLLQLPLQPGCAFEPTGNIPLAPGRLAAAAGLQTRAVMPADQCDSLSDREILSHIIDRKPDVLGFTLYMWNAERSSWLSRQVRKALPSVFTVCGGPEVTRDNRWLRESGAFHLMVEGEGEPFAAALNDPEQLHVLAERNSGFTSVGRCIFLPNHWPDPYFTGHLDSAWNMPAHVETIRGCPHMCSYCAYRRISPVPRVTPSEIVLETLTLHRNAGRTDLVFLDPTFNGRRDLSAVLAGMEGMGFSCFGEVRAGQPDLDAGAFAGAGFESVEVGLQTMNPGVLGTLGRSDNPEDTIRGALSLKAAGVEPVVDLILGLPEDDPEGILRAGGRLVSEGLGEGVQAFFLSVLPGTRLRGESARFGLAFMDRPPYWVTGLPGITEHDLMNARDELGGILGFDLDMEPRPILCDSWPHTSVLDTGSCFEPVFTGRHAVLRVRGSGLWENRHRILSAVGKRFEDDPFCVLDVVLQADERFPVDLLPLITGVVRPLDYHDRSAKMLGRHGRLRTAVIAGFDADPNWLTACASESVTVVPWKRLRQVPAELLERNVGLLLEGSPDLSRLSRTFSAHRELVFFRNMEMERLWCVSVLELG